MRIALAQLRCIVGDLSGNMARAAASIEQAHELGAECVVLPELTDTGYDLAAVRETGPAQREEAAASLTSAAKKTGCVVICGMSESAGGSSYNSLVVIGADGTQIARYRKIHLFRMGRFDERECFSTGDALVTVPLNPFTAGLMICYDLRFPELGRALVLRGADLLIVGATWPEKRIGHWRVLCAARAVENQCFIVAVNRVGVDSGASFGGNSMIVDPSGEIVCAADDCAERVIVGDLDMERVRMVRRSMRVFEDRRPSLYGDIGAMR